MRHLGFFITEALVGMKRSGLMIFIALGTITASLIVFGIFLLMTANMNHLAGFVTSRLEIRVFLNQNLSHQEISEFESVLTSLDDVQSVEFVDKEASWKEFKESYSTMELDDLLTDNPLPNAFKVELVDAEKIKDTSRVIEGYTTYVSDVVYGGVIAERMALFAKWAKIGGVILVGFLSSATLFIIVNTIRLTIMNRHEEIEIMKLVGATNSFISGPFMIEGLLMGCGGGLVAVIFLKFFYSFFAFRFQEALPYFPLIFKSSVLSQIFFSVFLLGAVLGGVGAYISISKILKKTV